MAWPAIAAAASAALPLAGDYMQFRNTQSLQQDQNDFTLRASSDAHQREVADMKAAGINPMLSAGGGGASTPSAGSVIAPANHIGSSVSSALDIMQTLAQINNLGKAGENIDAQTGAVQAGTLKTIADTDVSKGQLPLQQSLGRLQAAQTENAKFSARDIASGLPKKELDAQAEAAGSPTLKAIIGQVDSLLRRVSPWYR